MENVLEFDQLFEAENKKSNGLGPAVGSMKWLMADGKTALAFKLIGAVKAEKKAKSTKKGVEQATKNKQKIVGEIFASAAKGREKYKKMDKEKRADLDKKAESLKAKFKEMEIK